MKAEIDLRSAKEKQTKAVLAMLEKVSEVKGQYEDIAKNNTWNGNVYSYKFHK
jgi:hypothetical protein